MNSEILVREKDGAWHEWHGDETVSVMVSTFTATFHDGRPAEEMPCEPYPVEMVLNGDKVARLYAEGVWTLAEVEEHGGRLATTFSAPKGKVAVGAARYEVRKGQIVQVFDVEDEPAPPAPPTPEEKIAALGLTREDLIALVGSGQG